MPLIFCYRAWRSDLGDQGIEMVWRWVSQCGGFMTPHTLSVDFYVPERVSSFLVIQWPQLERRPLRDYIE